MTTDVMNPDDATVSQSQIAFIKSVIAPGRSDNEIALLAHLSKHHNLDPLSGEIYLLPFGSGPARPFVSYAGMLRIAHRSGFFDGIESELVYTDDGKIVGARARVWVKGSTHPCSSLVLMNEYNSGKSVWASKPATMIMKVAKAHALRDAFDLNGLYIEEEFMVVSNSSAEPMRQEVRERKKVVEDVVEEVEF